jgi:hypothetical protein
MIKTFNDHLVNYKKNEGTVSYVSSSKGSAKSGRWV